MIIEKTVILLRLLKSNDRGVAQLVAYLVWDQRVVSSSLATPTKKRALQQMQKSSFIFQEFLFIPAIIAFSIITVITVVIFLPASFRPCFAFWGLLPGTCMIGLIWSWFLPITCSLNIYLSLRIPTPVTINPDIGTIWPFWS